MREDFDPSYDDNNNNQDRLVKLEDMFSDTAYYYFDVNEWEVIIDHYLNTLRLEKAVKALDFAQYQHPNSAELNLKKAEVFMEQNELDEALSVLKNLDEIYPFNPDIFIGIGDVYSRKMEHYSAIIHYKKALGLCEDGKEDIYIQLAAECQSLEKPAQSIYWLKVMMNEFPDSIEGLYEMAFCYEVNGNQKLGAEFFKSFLHTNPYNHHAWFNLGNLYTTLEKYEEALNAFDYSVISFEEFSSGWYNKGNILGRLSRYQEAIEAFERTLELEGPAAQTHFYIGDCFENLEKFGKAKIAYQKAIELDEDHLDAWIGAANCYLELGDGEEALNYCEKALKLNSDNSLVQYLYGDVCKSLGYFDAAKRAYDKVIELDHKNSEIYLDYSDLYFCNDEKYLAIEMLETGLEKFKNQPDLIYRMGTYHFLMGRKNNAFEFWTNATIIDDNLKQSIFEYCPQLMADVEIKDFFS